MSRVRGSDDSGLTLIELAVAMALIGTLIGLIGTAVAGQQRTAKDVVEVNNLNEEARVMVNRISRELRQAKSIIAVAGTDGKHGMTFAVDFNNNDVIDTGTSDPEELTYTYDGTRVLLSAADDTGAVASLPVLSGVVNTFSLSYRSNLYLYDCNGDGETTWQELDAGCPAVTAPVAKPAVPPKGNANGVLDGPELPYIDSIILAFTVAQEGKNQGYRTRIDLRNSL